MIAKALSNLRPEASFVVSGNSISGIDWQSPDIDMPTEAEINTELGRLEQELLDTQYQRDRQYPDIGDQLDMLWHAIDAGSLDSSCDFYTTIKQVKDDNPKPE